jgi:hypothetical protein
MPHSWTTINLGIISSSQLQAVAMHQHLANCWKKLLSVNDFTLDSEGSEPLRLPEDSVIGWGKVCNNQDVEDWLKDDEVLITKTSQRKK